MQPYHGLALRLFWYIYERYLQRKYDQSNASKNEIKNTETEDKSVLRPCFKCIPIVSNIGNYNT